MRKYLNVHFIECFQLKEISFKNLQMQSLTFHLVRSAFEPKFSYWIILQREKEAEAKKKLKNELSLSEFFFYFRFLLIFYFSSCHGPFAWCFLVYYREAFPILRFVLCFHFLCSISSDSVDLYAIESMDILRDGSIETSSQIVHFAPFQQLANSF